MYGRFFERGSNFDTNGPLSPVGSALPKEGLDFLLLWSRLESSFGGWRDIYFQLPNTPPLVSNKVAFQVL